MRTKPKSIYLFLIVLFGCILYGCVESSNEVVIIGQLEGVEDGTVMELAKSNEQMMETIFSDTVKNGEFRFSFPDSIDKTAKNMYIMSRGEGFPLTWLNVWVAPGTTTRITGKDKLLRTWTVKNKVPEQIELNKYNSRTESYSRESQLVRRDVYSYFDKIEKEPERRAEFRAKIDSLYAINDSLTALMFEAEIDCMAENKTYSQLWMKNLSHNAMGIRFVKTTDAYMEKLKSLYEGMSDALKESEEGQAAYVNLYPPTVVENGDDMADADMWNLEGELCHLSDNQGKYQLLDFWSSGCGPCIMAIPEMGEIAEMYKDQLVVVSISSDPKDVWERISKEKEITWVNLNDFKGENGIKLRYGVRGIPHYVMISPDGKVMTSWAGYGKGSLKNKMKELVK